MKKLVFPLIIFLFFLLLVSLWYEGKGQLPQKQESQASKVPAGWIEYTSPSQNFTAFFPAEPQFTSQLDRNDQGDPVRTTQTYSVQSSDDTLYVVHVIRYHTPLVLPPEKLIDNVLYEMLAESPQNQLIGFKRSTFQGDLALEFSMVNDRVQIDTLAFIHDQDLVILTSMSWIERFHEEVFDQFIASFKLTK